MTLLTPTTRPAPAPTPNRADELRRAGRAALWRLAVGYRLPRHGRTKRALIAAIVRHETAAQEGATK